MARPLRIEFAGALYHVISRGNARAPIFVDDPDRLAFLDVLGRVVEQSRWLCHAYCLMPNHYHLVVETPEPNLSRWMRQLNGVYTQRFNRVHERVGHVFQGRFKAVLVERESHLLELARYVVLNPVRAGIAAAEDYPWSSLRATLGLARRPSWLAVRALLGAFGSPERYRQFVRAGLGVRTPLSGLRGSVLGSEGFAERVAVHAHGPASPEVPRRERLAPPRSLEALFPPRVHEDRSLRNERIREATQRDRYSLAEVGRHLGLHYATISRIAALGR